MELKITLVNHDRLRIDNQTAEDLLVELFDGELFVVGILPFTESDCRIVAVDGGYTREDFFTTMDTLRSGQAATYRYWPKDDTSRPHEPNVLSRISLFELNGYTKSGHKNHNYRNLYVYSPHTKEGLRCAELLLYKPDTDVSALDFPQNLCEICPK